MFDDILAANRAYASSFQLGGLRPGAARGLGVLTCIDSRIEPLAMLGLVPGEAKIMRNAGGRVTDDVIRSLVLAVNLLGVERFCIVQHTRCALVGATNEGLHDTIGHQRGADATHVDFLPIDDPAIVMAADVARVRASTLLPADLAVGTFVYDVDTGLLRQFS
jgi:carbonic anhydrase